MPYPTSATYPTTAHYPGAGVAYPSAAQYPGATPFTPPAHPPVAGFLTRYESRQINLTAPQNPSGGANFSNWASLVGSDSVSDAGSNAIYEVNDLGGTLPTVNNFFGQFLGTQSFTVAAYTFVFVGILGQAGAFIRVGDNGDNGLTLTGGANFTLTYRGTVIDGPVSDNATHTHEISWDGVSTLEWWIDGSLVVVSTGIVVSTLTNDLVFNNLPQIFAFIGWPSNLSWANKRTIGQWFAGTGAGAPATGLTWADDPIGWITFELRLQTNTPFAKTTPINLYQDTAGTIPAVADGDPVARRNDFITSSLFESQSNAMQQPVLRFVSGVPTVTFDGISDNLSLPLTSVPDFIFALVYLEASQAAYASYLQQNTGIDYGYWMRNDGGGFWAFDANNTMKAVSVNGVAGFTQSNSIWAVVSSVPNGVNSTPFTSVLEGSDNTLTRAFNGKSIALFVQNGADQSAVIQAYMQQLKPVPPWTPAQSSPVLWLDGDGSEGNGNPVSSRTDLSGTVGTYVQATGGDQPLLVADSPIAGQQSLQGAAGKSLIASTTPTPFTSELFNTYAVFWASYNPSASNGTDQVGASINTVRVGVEFLVYRQGSSGHNFFAWRSQAGGVEFACSPADEWHIEAAINGIGYRDGLALPGTSYAHGGSANTNDFIEGSSNSFLGKGKALIAYDEPSMPQAELVWNYLSSITGVSLATGMKDLIVFSGNSLALGYLAPPGDDPWTDLTTTLGSSWDTSNFFDIAVGGQTTTTMITADPPKLAGFWSPRRTHNVLFVWEFVNDINHNSLTPAQALANMQTYCAARKSEAVLAGTTLTIILGKMISQDANPTPSEAQRNTLSGLVDGVALGPYWDGVANFNLDSELVGNNVWNNLTYFQPDKIHLTAAGYAIAAARIYSTMQSMGLA